MGLRKLGAQEARRLVRARVGGSAPRGEGRAHLTPECARRAELLAPGKYSGDVLCALYLVAPH